MNLKEKAYNVLKNKIIRCELVPGQMLDEKLLIKEIGVSRTPIREAINALAQEGLVRTVPRRGVFVTEITIKDISDLYQVREELDPFITKLSTPHIPEERLIFYQEMFRKLKNENFDSTTERDDSFHKLIIQSCNNGYLIRMMDNIYVQNQRIRVLSTKFTKNSDRTINEHLKIIQFLLQRDADNAAEAMREHIILSREEAFKLNFAQQFVSYS